jgi:hypothetical protein
MYKRISQHLYSLFVINTSVVAIQKPDGRYVTAQVSFSPFLIEQMLKRGYSLGVYQQQTYKDTLRWICFDFDCKDVKDLEKLREEYIVSFIEKLDKLNINYVVEFSGRRGFHIWIIFDSVISKNLGYRIVDTLSRDFYMKLVCDKRFGIDLFPKTTSGTKKNKYGLQVKLPLSKHKKGYYSYLIDNIKHYDFVTVNKLDENFLKEQYDILQNIKINRVEDVVEKLGIRLIDEDETYWKYSKQIKIVDSMITIEDIKHVFESDNVLRGIWNNISNGVMSQTDRFVVLGMLGHIRGGENVLNEIFKMQKNYNATITKQMIMQNRKFYYPITITYLHELYHSPINNYQLSSTTLDDYLIDKLSISSVNQPVRTVLASKGFSEIENIIRKEINYLKYNDEVINIEILMELQNMKYYDIKEIDEYLSNVYNNNSTVPTKINYEIYTRIEKDKERKLLSLYGRERVITTCLIYELIKILQKDYDSYSYHLNLSNQGDIFYPWVTSWLRFKKDITQYFTTELFDDISFIKVDLKNFYGNIFLQSIYSHIENASTFEEKDSGKLKNIIKYLFAFNDKLMVEVTNKIRGVPQGPAYARVLAELALEIVIEQFWNKYNFSTGNIKCYRYVDDIYIFHDDNIESTEFLYKFSNHLENWGLFLNKTKTRCYGKIKGISAEELSELREFGQFNYDISSISELETRDEDDIFEAVQIFSRYINRELDWDINDANFLLSSNVDDHLVGLYMKRYYEKIIGSIIGRGSVFYKFYTRIFQSEYETKKFFNEKQYCKIPQNSINFQNMITTLYLNIKKLCLEGWLDSSFYEFLKYCKEIKQIKTNEISIINALEKYFIVFGGKN